jgi:hypothetical protein
MFVARRRIRVNEERLVGEHDRVVKGRVIHQRVKADER